MSRCACLPPRPLSLEVSVLVLPVGLQHHGDGGHEGLHHAELQRGLLTEAQEADGVGAAPQAARPVHTAGPGEGGPPRRLFNSRELKRLYAGLSKCHHWGLNTKTKKGFLEGRGAHPTRGHKLCLGGRTSVSVEAD